MKFYKNKKNRGQREKESIGDYGDIRARFLRVYAKNLIRAMAIRRKKIYGVSLWMDGAI
jgi:hypothetical protein